MFTDPIQQVQFWDKYARYLPDEQRRETWPEACQRVINFFKSHTPLRSDDPMWQELHTAMLNHEVMPSMRILQMAGPVLDKCHVGAYNCAYVPLDSPSAFSELLYILMQGTGCGFSVERRYADAWPIIADAQSMNPIRYVIEDSTEEWCDAFHAAINFALQGMPVEFDYSRIRAKGTRLKTKGGYASGPDPLRKLLATTTDIIRNKAGQKLSSFDLHRIATLAGEVVQVGGIRRSAQISLSDLDDVEMRDAKQGKFWERYPELAQANNSAVYDEKPSWSKFLTEWTAIEQSGTGERGIFNRQHPPVRTLDDFGTNPCGEIILRPRQFCNLSIAVVRAVDDEEALARKVRLATIFGTLQSCLTNFNYLSSKWKENCDDERLLGVDLMGTMDHPILNAVGAPARLLLDRLRLLTVRTNREWARKLGINESTAITCNKPSGNSSVLLGTASGIHPRYAKYYIRRLRIKEHTPLSNYLMSVGVPAEREFSSDCMVFEFPVQSPEGAKTRHDVSAIDQFHYWAMFKQYWTDHNPSCTIYVEDHEWAALGRLIYGEWAMVGGLSFLPKDNHIYPLMPYEEITEEEYKRRHAAFPALDLQQIVEGEDITTRGQDFACVGGSCDI